MCLDSNRQNCSKHTHRFCNMVTQSRWRPISSSPWRKDITNSHFALLSNCYCDLCDGFNNPSKILLDFGFQDFCFFLNLFSKRGMRRVSALPRNPWGTYLSPVLSWMPDAQCFLLTEFSRVVWGYPLSYFNPTQEDSVVCGIAFLLQKLFFICLFVHFSVVNFYLTVQWTVSNPVFL